MTTANRKLVAPPAIEEKPVSAWDTESGLVDDIDAWMSNCRFGKKEEYAAKVALSEGGSDESSGLMFLVDLIDETGEKVAEQGWSIGSGWTPADDGSEISHPKRNNVVKSTLYGQLQDKVRGDLGVDMEALGLPTVAASWNGLGFHWNQLSHATLDKNVQKSGLMPTAVLEMNMDLRNGTAPAPAPAAKPVAGVRPAVKPPTTAKKGVSVAPALETRLNNLAKASPDADTFALAATKLPGASGNDDLMKELMDDSDAGYWAKHHGG